jgi:hypothetical protein
VPNYSVFKVGDGSVDADSFNSLIDALNAAGGGGVATDVIFDAAGDIPVGSGIDASQKLPVGTTGQVLTADTAQPLKVKWAAASAGGAYAAYTATLSAVSGGLVIGSTGTQDGRWCAVGKTVHAFGRIQFNGTGVAAGTGRYNILLPTPAATAAVNLAAHIGVGQLFDSSAPALANVYAELEDATHASLRYPATWPTGVNTTVSNTAPWTWATGDFLDFFFVYEAA